MKFRFEAYDRTAKMVRGELEASSENDAKRSLREQGYSVRNLAVIRSSMSIAESFTVGKKPSLKEFSIFVRQWAVMQSAGLPVLQALGVLSEEGVNKNFGRVLAMVAKSVQEGLTLAQALQRHPGVFDRIFINLIGAGESSGTLDRILDRLASYYEKTEKLKRRVIGAFLYPGFIMFFLLAIVIGLLVFVVPIFQNMFKDQGKELPELTMMLIRASDFIRNNIISVMIGFVSIIGFIVFICKDASAREKLDPLLLRVPVFGNIVRASSTARFCRTLGTLVQAGVPILDAFVLSAKTAGNYEIERAAMAAQLSIKEGNSIAQTLAAEKTFPKMVISMISVGEQTGQLEKMLQKIAEFYEDEVETTVATLSSILEPFLIIAMGLVVLSVLIPLYLPLFKIGDLMGA